MEEIKIDSKVGSFKEVIDPETGEVLIVPNLDDAAMKARLESENNPEGEGGEGA